METLLSKLVDQVFSTQNIALIILFAGNIYQAMREKSATKAREESDKADREYARLHTEAIKDLTVALSKIEGFLMRGMR